MNSIIDRIKNSLRIRLAIVGLIVAVSRQFELGISQEVAQYIVGTLLLLIGGDTVRKIGGNDDSVRNPESAEAVNWGGMTLQEQIQDTRDAITQLEKAVVSDPQSPSLQAMRESLDKRLRSLEGERDT